MPKRTSNSSVNSSIRQQTKSNDEGLGNLLETQKASLGELSSIRQLLELSKEYQKNQQVSSGNADAVKMQMELLRVAKEHGETAKRHRKSDEQQYKELIERTDGESKKLEEIAKSMNTTGNMFQEMGKSFKEKVQGVKEKTSIKDGGLKRTVLGSLNVGGIFNKAIAKSEWSSKQRAMGFSPSKEDAEGAYNASKAMQEHSKEVEKFQKKTGITDEAEMRRTPAGAALLDKRTALGDELTKYDRGAQRVDPTVVGNVNPNAKTPTANAAKETQNEEAQLEGVRAQGEMKELLTKIAENTKPVGQKGGATPEKVKPAEGGGLLDTITSFLGEGLMKTLKSIFSPARLLKGLLKVFAIGAIVGALWEGIKDGFDEFMATGDIGKALVAGLAGIVDFLTFGLFDKEKIKEVIGNMADWVGDHIVKPISGFFSEMKNSFLNLLSNIGIPEIKLGALSKLPGVPEKIGPWYPFKDLASGAKPEAAAPTTASAVEQKSADNAAAAIPETTGGNKTNVVNAPVVNNTTQNQVIRAPIRNQDSSAGSYMRGRYAT
jgi:hypothetical protein